MPSRHGIAMNDLIIFSREVQAFHTYIYVMTAPPPDLKGPADDKGVVGIGLHSIRRQILTRGISHSHRRHTVGKIQPGAFKAQISAPAVPRSVWNLMMESLGI